MKCLKGTPKSPLILCRWKYRADGVTIYSDGYCEMFGRRTVNTNFANRQSWTFTRDLPIPYKDTDYNVILTGRGMANDKHGLFGLNVENLTNQSFDACFYTNTGADEISIFHWTTKGYVNLEDPTVKKFIEDNK